MTTKLPQKVTETLQSVGEVAAELPCDLEGYREFVVVVRFKTDRIFGFASQYPYLADLPIAYRVMRFRVDSQVIENDRDCGNDDLVGLQSLHVPTIDDVQYILRIWQVSPSILRQPNETDVPI